MSTVTLSIPDSKHQRLRLLAKSKDISLNKLFDELATVALTEFDSKTRFMILASKGDKNRGLELLDKIEGSNFFAK